MQTVPIALLGCGTVGSGVVRVLTEDGDFLARRTGLKFAVRYVLAKEANPRARAALEAGGAKWVDSIDPILADGEVRIAVELIGGDRFALDCSRKLLSAGKALVTANKAMLARHGGELFGLAHAKNSCIGFEASCAGGVPLILALRDGMVANRIRGIYGILNGTTNYILTEMVSGGKSYADALAEAQAAGYAEADPTFDVDGTDAAHKITILAALAFGQEVDFAAVSAEGIADLQRADIVYARELGYTVKLLAIAEQFDGSISVRVHPALVSSDNPLAAVGGVFNAISIFGHAVGHVLLYGRGAGQSPTASAVVSDLVDVANGHAAMRFKTLRIWPGKTAPARMLDGNELAGRYYIRLSVLDRPGVMAQVSRVLGEHNISISGVLQKETSLDRPDLPVDVVITTHRARAGDVRAALAGIDALPISKAPAVRLRVLDLPDEAVNSGDEWNRKAGVRG